MLRVSTTPANVYTRPLASAKSVWRTAATAVGDCTANRPAPVATLATTWRATQARAWPAGEIEAGRGGLVGGVDVQLVDLEVGQLADPHETAVPQHHLGGAALSGADAVALGEPRALLERLGGRLPLGDPLHRGPREDDLGGAHGLRVAGSRRPEERGPRRDSQDAPPERAVPRPAPWSDRTAFGLWTHDDAS